MLESISWKEYWTLMAGAVGLYYGWWAITYRGSLIKGGWKVKTPVVDDRLASLYAQPFTGGAKEVKAPVDAPVEGTEAVKAGSAGVAAAAGEATPAAGVDTLAAGAVTSASDAVMPAPEVAEVADAMPVPAVLVSEEGGFLSVVAADLVKGVAALAERAASDNMGEAGFELELRELIQRKPHWRLKGTDYQGKVSDEIVQVLKSLGSIRLDAERVRELWDG